MQRTTSWYKMKALRSRVWRETPTYRMKSGPRVMRDRLTAWYLDPELLLSKGERREAHSLLARLMRMSVSVVDEDGSPQRNDLLHRLERVASGALRRCVGLERFMVVRIRRGDGHSVACRLETLTLEASRFGLSRLQWSVDGKGLRKDMTVGSSRAGISFISAHISRRLLTGRWASTKLSFKTRRENALSSW